MACKIQRLWTGVDDLPSIRTGISVAELPSGDPHTVGLTLKGILVFCYQCEQTVRTESLIISWFEQKAVAVRPTLLALRVRNIRLGPTLPAFLRPALLDILVKRYGIAPITTAQADINAALSPKAA